MQARVDSPTARRFLDRSKSVLPDLIREVIAISDIPAPTYDEGRRSAYVAGRMGEVGLEEVEIDSVGNAIGHFRGSGGGPTLLFAAHIDTVFPLETHVTVQIDGDILRGPSVGDNSASVAVMLFMADLFRKFAYQPASDLIFVATVGEEGLGNLRGMRTVMERFGPSVDYVVTIDGSMGSLVRQGVGSRRYRVLVSGEGGHSWGAFGTPSAIHSLGHIVSQLSNLRVPANPKTTFNVGTIRGGTSVNTIAAEAEAVIDLRSLDPGELGKLEERVQRIVSDVARQAGVSAEMELLGDRPTGSIPEDHPLCRAVRQLHYQLGIQTRSYPSSTDSNIPLSMGIPAVTVGVTLGGNGHRLDEYIHTPPLAKGLGQMLLLTLSLQQLPLRPR